MSNQITPNPSVPTQVVAEVKFPRWINNLGIIPTSYKDSMSYYECLAWLCKFLEETVIPSVNENGEAVEELQNLYIELNSYVTHYFETLDVQEEINNKLDDMVEDGTLPEIVADYLNSKAVFGFDTVAAMKAGTNLINGSYARTLGYYTKNDGGSALYKIRNITNSDVIDEMFIIAMDDSENQLIAELICENNIVDIKQLGAKGDGLTDNTSIMQNASSYAEDKEMTFYVPEGEYLTDTFTLNEINLIKIDGIIKLSDASEMINIYENVNNGKNPDIAINSVKVGKIHMEGLNSAHVSIQYAKTLELWATSTADKRYIGYTTFELGYIESLIIGDDGSVGPKWVNENLFVGGRFLNIDIGTGTSTYNHQHNMFLKPMCEHTTITIDHGIGNRFINARLEGTPTITFGTNSIANVITSNYASTADNYYIPKQYYRLQDYVTDNSGGKNKVIANEDLVENLVFSLNKFNPNGLTVSGDNVVANGSTLMFETGLVALPPVDSCLYINSSNKKITLRLECYDETFTKLTTNPSLLIGSSAVPYQSAGTYGNSSFNRNDYWFLMNSTNESVKYVKLKVYCPSGQGLSNEPYNNIDIYLTHYGRLDREGYYVKGFGTQVST